MGKLRIKIEVGHEFGRLRVESPADRDKNGNDRWLCKCKCGKEKIIYGQSLRTRATQSCGCLQKEVVAERAAIHGMHRSPEYTVWEGMISRCYNTKHRNYRHYGGRGIAVCPEWRTSFKAFYDHIGPRPSAGYMLDRVDNDRGYEPGNVRWTDRFTSARNTRRNRFLMCNGESRTISEWSELLNIHCNTIYSRLRLGWSVEKTLTTPVKGKKDPSNG